MKRLLILLALTISLASHLLARPYNFMLSDKNLSSSLINSIYQDRDGMIWISTENGLNRYDGTKVSIYKHDDHDPGSVAHNYVRYCYEDQEGHFLVGSYIGLQLYNRDTDDFSPLITFADGQQLLSSPAYIAETPDGRIFTSGNQVCEVRFDDGTPHYYNVQWEGFDPVMTGQVHCGQQGNLWCHKMNDAVIRISADGRVTRYEDVVPSHEISDLLCDDIGNIYLQTTRHDLYRFDIDRDSWHKVNTSPVSSSMLKCIYRLDADRILVGTDGNGLKLVNELTGEVRDYTIDLPALTSKYLKVHEIIRDHDGDLWMALFLKGIARIPMQQSSFRYLGSQSVATNLVGSSSISALHADHSGQIWVGTDGEGLYRLNPTLHTSHHYATTTDGGTMPAIVQAIYEDSEGTIWVGSYDEGCGRIDHRSGRFTSCKELFHRQDAIATRIYAFTEDDRHRLWVATLGHGLFCYDLHARRVIDELSFHRGQVNLWETCLLITSRNQLLVGTYDGVYAIDLNDPTPQPRHVFDRNIIFSLYEDPEHQLWAGSADGLMRFSLDSPQLEVISEAEGLAGNSAFSIMGDSAQTLWIGTNHGLSHYMPASRTFINYSDADGLQGNEFSKNVCCQDRNGQLWFGGAYGISFFHPAKVHQNGTQLHVRITGLYVNNEPIHGNSLSGGKRIVEGALHKAREFSLAHTDNHFSIELSTVEFSDPDIVRYEYSLDDGPWASLPQGSHLVSFSDLRLGHHNFRYRVTDGQTESAVSEVGIFVRPAWWESPWAMLSYILIVLLIIATFIYQARVKYTTERKMLLQQHEHEINEAKLHFFTNITHEIRTPMTLIMSPLQKLISTDADAERQHSYQIMLRNARMLLQLANQLLDIRKIDNKQMKLLFSETDAIASLQDLYTYFKPFAAAKHIRFAFLHDGLEHLPLWVDPGYFTKIITNLLTNAFKYTPDGGAVSLCIRKSLDNSVSSLQSGQAQIVVTDTGVGIPAEDLERIFERFYRTKATHATDGNGIGLHLTRSLVTLHHGTIQAMNNADGPGSTFIVTLPLGNAHLSADEVKKDSEPRPSVGDNTPLLAPHPALGEPSGTPFPTTTPASASAPRTRTKYRLLLVDDDDEIRTYLASELASDFHITECTDGQQALQSIFRQKPDLIISDIMMPEVDGISLCQRVKSNTELNHIPVILLTAKADQESNLAGIESGADAYITKPFYIEILRSTALNLVKTRTQLRNSYAGQQTQDDKLQEIEMPTANDKLMERIMRVVNQNLSNQEFSIDDICQEVGISRVHLYRKLKELTNQSPRDFIRNVRLKQAERLLLKGSYSINEIAEAVGFSRPNNFSAAFKEQYGYPPLQWKAMQTQSNAEPTGGEQDPAEGDQEPAEGKQ